MFKKLAVIQKNTIRRSLVAGTIGLGFIAPFTCSAQTATSGQTASQHADSIAEAADKQTKEPVYRVSKLGGPTSSLPLANVIAAASLATPAADAAAEPAAVSSNATEAAAEAKPAAVPDRSADIPEPQEPHELDRAIEMARKGLDAMRANINDYSAIMVKRERVDGVIMGPEYMKMKVRCPRTVEGKEVPFSLYFKFLKPRKSAGREVIWVDGENDGKLCVHEGGLLGMKRFYFDPTGWVAMKGNRYPVFEAGLENLMIKLIEKAERDRAAGPCKVTYRDNAQIMKRKCSLIELVHEEKKAPYEFYKAQVFIDQELNLPCRFVSYDWPKPGQEPEVIEEYTYVKINVNQGFEDIDFSPENPVYKFPNN